MADLEELTVGFAVGFMVDFAGFIAGFTAGFAAGFTAGFVVGFVVGFAVGFAVGFVVDFVVDFIGFKIEDLLPFLVLEARISARVQGNTKTSRISIQNKFSYKKKASLTF